MPAQLGRRAGLRVANLGQPGIGPIQALHLYRAKGERLKPRRVFICLHHNDAQDSLDAFEPAALEAFLRRPQDPPLARAELRAAPALDGSFVIALGDALLGRGAPVRVVERLAAAVQAGAGAAVAVEEIAAQDTQHYGIVAPAGTPNQASIPRRSACANTPRSASYPAMPRAGSVCRTSRPCWSPAR